VIAHFEEVEVTISQRSKIHRLAYRFSIDFSLLGLAYGFLCRRPIFLFGNHKHSNKFLDFWFAGGDFLDSDFHQDFCFLRLFHNTVKYFINQHFLKVKAIYLNMNKVCNKDKSNSIHPLSAVGKKSTG
jgi:hypothetical protein